MNHHNKYASLKVTVMGLGLNGGGVASAAYFARQGAVVTATDLRSAEVLAPSIQALDGLGIRYVLGRHDEADFRDADLVVKNPAVRANNPYLALAKRVETDLSIFLREIENPIWAVTGSKGKSSVATALHAILMHDHPGARLGGNIAVSPLSFVDELGEGAPIVLELSSWQLGDLRGLNVLKPRVAIVTNLLWDHMNVYSDQTAYALDKAVILENQNKNDWAILNADQTWGEWFASRSRAQTAVFSVSERPSHNGQVSIKYDAEFWLDAEGRGWGLKNNVLVELLPPTLRVPGRVFRGNCLLSAAAAWLGGHSPSQIRQSLEDFGGVPHRLENFWRWNGIDFFDDTAATIPEAAVASYQAFSVPVCWITGGTDKNLDLGAFETLSTAPARLVLLAGSATERLIPILKQKDWSWLGPFATMDEAVEASLNDNVAIKVVLLSPGAASFEHFKNEFDRGKKFQSAVIAKTPQGFHP